MKSDQPYKAHPIDPTADLEDVIGDTTGKTGATTNAVNDKGNAPMGSQIDKTHQPGGVIQTPKTVQVKKDPADPDQNPQTPQALQDNFEKLANDIADDNDANDIDRNALAHTSKIVTGQGQTQGEVDLDSEPDIHNVELTAPFSPDELDELSMSGSAPDVDVAKDMLQEAQNMGFQLEEDSENPEELDMARDINKAEELVHE